MNQNDRKELSKATELVYEALLIIQELAPAIEEKAENAEEYFPNSEATERLQDEACKLDEAMTSLEVIHDDLEEISE